MFYIGFSNYSTRVKSLIIVFPISNKSRFNMQPHIRSWFITDWKDNDQWIHPGWV